MKLVLFNGNRLSKLILPKKVEGSFWLEDELNNNTNIINVEAQDGKWILKGNDEAKIIYGNSYVAEVEIIPNYFYYIEYNENKMFLYSENYVGDNKN